MLLSYNQRFDEKKLLLKFLEIYKNFEWKNPIIKDNRLILRIDTAIKVFSWMVFAGLFRDEFIDEWRLIDQSKALYMNWLPTPIITCNGCWLRMNLKSKSISNTFWEYLPRVTFNMKCIKCWTYKSLYDNGEICDRNFRTCSNCWRDHGMPKLQQENGALHLVWTCKICWNEDMRSIHNLIKNKEDLLDELIKNQLISILHLSKEEAIKYDKMTVSSVPKEFVNFLMNYPWFKIVK